MVGRLYTREEDAQMIALVDAGHTYKTVATLLGTGRSTASISGRCQRLGIQSLNRKRPTTEAYNKSIEKYTIVTTEEYGRNKDIKIGHKCLVCGCTWNVRPGEILRGHGCPDCANKRRQGATRRDSNICFLYFIKLDIGYKIGITNNTTRRYRSFKQNNLVELVRVKGTGLSCSIVEQMLFEDLREYSWSNPSLVFNGVSNGSHECFTDYLPEDLVLGLLISMFADMGDINGI